MVAMIPSGFFTILRRVRSDPRTPEHTYRTFLFSKIVMYLENYRDELGTKWPAFAQELSIRLEPIVSSSTSGVSTKDLNYAADAIIDQCKACPDLSEQMVKLLRIIDEVLPSLSLPNDWSVKQDLLTNFHRMNDWLKKDESEREMMSLDSRSSSGSSAGMSTSSNGGEGNHHQNDRLVLSNEGFL